MDAEGELAGRHGAAGQGLGTSEAHGRAALGGGGVGVGEGNHSGLRAVLRRVHVGLRALGPTRDRGGRRQRGAFGVVGDGDGDRADCRVVGVASWRIADLVDLVGVRLAGIVLREGNVLAIQHVHDGLLAVGGSGHGHRKSLGGDAQRVGRRLVVGLHADGELALRHVAARERLGNAQAARGGVVQTRAVGVGEGGVLDSQINRNVIVNIDFCHYQQTNFCLIGAVIYAWNLLAILADFSDFVVEAPIINDGVRFRELIRGKRKRPEVEVRLALLEVGLRHGDAGHDVALGILRHGRLIGVVANGLELEGEAIRIQPVAALEHLGKTEVDGVVGGVANGQHAVVAKVGRDRRGLGDLLDAVPLGVQDVPCRPGVVVRLGLVELVDVDQAGRSGLEVRMAVVVGADGALERGRVGAGECHDVGLLNELAALQRVVGALVIVRLARNDRGGGLRATLVGVDGRVLREVVVAIGGGRVELRGGVTQVLVARPLVGVEPHVTVVVAVLRLVGRHVIVGLGNKVGHAGLQGRRVEDGDGLGGSDAKRAVREVDIEVSQRDDLGRDLHLHHVARPQVPRPRHSDDDVLQVGVLVARVDVALEAVGVDKAVGGLAGARIRLAVVDERREVGDLHVVAKLVAESDVAGGVGGPVLSLGGVAGRVADLLGDVLEDLLEALGVGRALVKVGIGGAVAEAPGLVGIGGARVVAGHRMQELILVRDAVSRGVERRVCAVKHADGVDRGASVLHFLGSRHGIGSDVRVEHLRNRGRAVGEEDDDLLGARTFGFAQHGLGRLEAEVGPRALRSRQGPDGTLDLGRLVAHAFGHALGDARRCVVAHDGNPMLLGSVGDARVLLGDFVHKQACRALQRRKLRRRTHTFRHGRGHVQHQHDVERRGLGAPQVGGGGKRGQRRQEVSAALLRDAGVLIVGNAVGGDGLVRPDAPDAARVVADKVPPALYGDRVAHRSALRRLRQRHRGHKAAERNDREQQAKQAPLHLPHAPIRHLSSHLQSAGDRNFSVVPFRAQNGQTAQRPVFGASGARQ